MGILISVFKGCLMWGLLRSLQMPGGIISVVDSTDRICRVINHVGFSSKRSFLVVAVAVQKSLADSRGGPFISLQISKTNHNE